MTMRHGAHDEIFLRSALMPTLRLGIHRRSYRRRRGCCCRYGDAPPPLHDDRYHLGAQIGRAMAAFPPSDHHRPALLDKHDATVKICISSRAYMAAGKHGRDLFKKIQECTARWRHRCARALLRWALPCARNIDIRCRCLMPLFRLHTYGHGHLPPLRWPSRRQILCARRASRRCDIAYYLPLALIRAHSLSTCARPFAARLARCMAAFSDIRG